MIYKIHDWFIDKVLSRWFLVSHRHGGAKLAIVRHNSRWMRK